MARWVGGGGTRTNKQRSFIRKESRSQAAFYWCDGTGPFRHYGGGRREAGSESWPTKGRPSYKMRASVYHLTLLRQSRAVLLRMNKWAQQDSNLRPADYE